MDTDRQRSSIVSMPQRRLMTAERPPSGGKRPARVLTGMAVTARQVTSAGSRDAAHPAYQGSGNQDCS